MTTIAQAYTRKTSTTFSTKIKKSQSRQTVWQVPGNLQTIAYQYSFGGSPPANAELCEIYERRVDQQEKTWGI